MKIRNASFAIVLFLFCLPLSMGSALANGASAPSAPPINCQLGTPVWCIINGYSEINLTTKAGSRIWTFLDPVSMHDGPITIIEKEPNCAQGQPLDVRKVSEQPSESYVSVIYVLTSEQECQFEVHLPMKNGVVEDTYGWAIKTAIQFSGRPLGIISH
jgi:hypothetical protein